MRLTSASDRQRLWRAVKKLASMLENNNNKEKEGNKILLVEPPGVGKTAIIIRLAAYLAQRGYITIISVPYRELRNKIYERLKKYIERIERFNKNDKSDESISVYVLRSHAESCNLNDNSKEYYLSLYNHIRAVKQGEKCSFKDEIRSFIQWLLVNKRGVVVTTFEMSHVAKSLAESVLGASARVKVLADEADYLFYNYYNTRVEKFYLELYKIIDEKYYERLIKHYVCSDDLEELRKTMLKNPPIECSPRLEEIPDLMATATLQRKLFSVIQSLSPKWREIKILKSLVKTSKKEKDLIIVVNQKIYSDQTFDKLIDKIIELETSVKAISESEANKQIRELIDSLFNFLKTLSLDSERLYLVTGKIPWIVLILRSKKRGEYFDKYVKENYSEFTRYIKFDILVSKSDRSRGINLLIKKGEDYIDPLVSIEEFQQQFILNNKTIRDMLRKMHILVEKKILARKEHVKAILKEMIYADYVQTHFRSIRNMNKKHASILLDIRCFEAIKYFYSENYLRRHAKVIILDEFNAKEIIKHIISYYFGEQI